MCLLQWYNTLRKEGCKGICRECACVSWFAIFILGPIGLVVGLLYALVLGLVKWIPGSFKRVGDCCQCYCDVINKGSEQYDVEAGRARPPPPARPGKRSFADRLEAETRGTGSKCAGELYCCCLPAFWALMLLYPVWILLELLIVGSIFGASAGMGAGCNGGAGFADRMRHALYEIDRHSSQAALGHGTPWCFKGDTAAYAPGRPAVPPSIPMTTPGVVLPPPQQPRAATYPPQQQANPPQPPQAAKAQPPLPVAYAQPIAAQPVAYAQPVAQPPRQY